MRDFPLFVVFSANFSAGMSIAFSHERNIFIREILQWLYRRSNELSDELQNSYAYEYGFLFHRVWWR